MNKLKNHLDKIGLTIVATLGLATPAMAQIDYPKNIIQTTTFSPILIIAEIGGWMLSLAGVLAVVYLIYGGISYIIGGTKGQEAAKGTIVSALVGLVIVALSYALANFVLQFFGHL